MKNKAPPTKWRATIFAIDIDTGEILDPERVRNGEYLIIGKNILATEQEGRYAIRIYEWRCRVNPQSALEF